jgi:hypothetical protein
VKTLKLAERGDALATRPRAAALRAEVEQEVAAGEVVGLNFDGVRAVSYSFADELVGALAELALGSGGHIRIEGATENVERTLLAAAERRGASPSLTALTCA